LKKLFDKYLKDNLGLINLFGKAFGRGMFLLLTSFFAYKLSVEDFAGFAIFWTTLRMFTFYSANNLYIIYFNEVREYLIENQKWPITISSNILITAIFFGVLSFVLSTYIFDDIKISILIVLTLFCSIVIRNLSEFAKSDNSLLLSIFIEDFLLYVLFFVLGVIGIIIQPNLETIVYVVFISTLITMISCLVLFKKKFKLKITNYKISINHFSFKHFKLGVNYTILRGNEVLSNFAVRYLGKIYFGDLFVAYAHIMYQFYNVFTLLTMSVISGLQSKITIKIAKNFNKTFVREMYIKVLKTIAPFVLFMLLVIVIFKTQILMVFFPKYVAYDTLLVKVALVGLLFMLIQPLVFILVYNKKVTNIIMLNLAQYLVVFAVYLCPLIYPKIDQNYWFLMSMVSFILVQGIYSILKYRSVQ